MSRECLQVVRVVPLSPCSLAIDEIIKHLGLVSEEIEAYAQHLFDLLNRIVDTVLCMFKLIVVDGTMTR